MHIIDRYMLRQFVQVFLICFSSLTGLYIVFDAFSNLDEFAKAAEARGNLLVVLGTFYAYRSVYFFDQTCGVLALISAMFTITWIQRHNELTALSAAGISTGRVIRPVIIAAIAISGFAAFSREMVIPRLSSQLSQDPKNLTGEHAEELQPCFDWETDILFRGREVYQKTRRIVEPSLFLPLELNQHGKQLKAAEGFYEAATAEHPNGYRLSKVTQPAGLDNLPSLSLGDRRILITPKDAPWLRAGEVFIVSNMDFEQLTGGSRARRFSSTWQLVRGLRNPSLDYGADVRVAIHARLVQPFLDTTLLFLGLPLILSRENRNLFMAIGLCAAVVTVFMLIVILCKFLGGIYFINPALAAWLPLMIFVPAAVFMADPLVR
jgi:lipopolysaccharide export system permease protein